MGNALFRFILPFVGMTLYWPLLRRNGLFYSLAGHDDTPGQALVWYAVFLLLVGIAVAVVAAIERRTADPWCHAPLILGACGIQATSKFSELTLAPQGAAGVAAALLSVASFAFAVVLLTCLWAAWFTRCERRAASLTAIASFAASLCVKETIWSIQGLAGLVVVVSTPLLSAACGRASVAHLRSAGDDNPRVGSRPGLEVARGFDGTTRATVTVISLFLLAGGIVRGFVYGAVNGDTVVSPRAQDLLTVCLLFVLFVLCVTSKEGYRFLQVSWITAASLFFAGLLAMTAFGDAWVLAAGEVVVVARTTLSLVFWLMLADVARLRPLSVVHTFGAVFLLVEAASSALGYIVVPQAIGSLDPLPVGGARALLVVITFALIVMTMVFFGRSRELFSPTAGTTGTAAEPAGIDGIGGPTGDATPFERFGLTEREIEVARLLASGNSQKKISDVLGISIGTVQSHVKGIYRKFDVHSRQEFIDALHEEHPTE